MSYDFMMFKAAAPIASPDDLSETTTALQDGAEVVARLNELYPGIRWEHPPRGSWFGVLDADDGRYEFSIEDKLEASWSIYTSHRAATRLLIQEICTALQLIAFDGQKMELIFPDPDSPQRRS